MPHTHCTGRCRRPFGLNRVTYHHFASDPVGSDRQNVCGTADRTREGFESLTYHSTRINDRLDYWDGTRVGLDLFQLATKLGVLYPALFGTQPTSRMSVSSELVVWVLFAPQYSGASIWNSNQ